METEVGVAAAPGAELTLPRTLRWHHVFALCFPPTAINAFLNAGFISGSIGMWGYVLVTVVISVVCFLQALLFAEMAGMFPDKSGGIGLYASEAWRHYNSWLGPLATFGYWIAWVLAAGLSAMWAGNFAQAQWFSGATWSWTVPLGGVHVGLAHIIAIAMLVAGWWLNYRGVQIAARVTQVITVVFLIIVVILVAGQFAGAGGAWHLSNLTWNVTLSGDGWKILLIWMYIMMWTLGSSEFAAVFVPEYKDQKRDTYRGVVSIAIGASAVMILVPVAAAGQLGEQALAENPVTFAVTALQNMLGKGVSGFCVAVFLATLFVGVVGAMADSSRALFGMSRGRLTLKQFERLNKHEMPGRSITASLVVNVIIVLFVGNVLGILLAGNLGYVLAFILAVTGFVLLRRDRPGWPRPFRLRGGGWVPIAVVIAAFEALLCIVGVLFPGLAGYGGLKETVIGFAILAVGMMGFVYRRRFQDHEKLTWRERTSPEPGQADAAPGTTGREN
jgi:amino acid transporter